MTLTSAIALGIATLIFALTPGPGVFAAVSQALSYGFRAGLYTIVGIVVGDLIFLILAIWGLAAIAEAMGEFFLLIKIIGALYLIYLGWRMWVATPKTLEIGDSGNACSFRQGFLVGLFVTLSNPKVILFYLSFLPTFMNLQALILLDIVLVMGIVTTMLLIVLSGYAYLAARTRILLTQPTSLKVLQRSAGTVMIGVGVALVTR